MTEAMEKKVDGFIDWLRKLQDRNKGRRCQFINGFIQSLHGLKILSRKLSYMGFPYLCQDPVELFFGKIRINRFPRPTTSLTVIVVLLPLP